MKARTFKVKRTAPWLARLALFALLFQITAFDHHAHPTDVTGVLGSSNHEMHCHGSLGSCANGSGEMPAALTQVALLPSVPSLQLLAALTDFNAPQDADLAIGSEPPRT